MRLLLALLGFWALAQAPAGAQSYPSKNVTLVVPFAPGGASDIMGRAIGQKLSEIWKQPVIIDNKPGASTTLGTAYAATQPADGYTLMIAPPPFVITQHVYTNLKYKPLEDFRAAAVIAYYPLITVVNNDLPINNLKELFEYARKHPGTPFASVGPGSSPHLMSEYMAREEKLDMVHVPYRSGGQVFADLLSGRIAFYTAPSTEVVSQINAGKVRAIAVLTDTRLKLLPNLATSAEQGFPKYRGASWSTLVVPAKTPAAIVDKINQSVVSAITDPAFRAKLEEQGAQFLDKAGPAEAQQFLVNEDKLWAPMVKASGVQPE